MTPEQILKTTFGFDAFRGVQRDVVDRVMEDLLDCHSAACSSSAERSAACRTHSSA